jgi:hypothetical protein
MECKPARWIASSFPNNVSTSAPSFAVIVSRKALRLRARAVSNASRYIYRRLVVAQKANLEMFFINTFYLLISLYFGIAIDSTIKQK